MNSFSKIKPGDILPGLPAQPWNELLDMLRWWKGTQNPFPGAATAPNFTPQPGIVTVKNESGADADRFSILKITDALINEFTNFQHFKNRPTFTVDTPDDDLLQNFVITQEPIADGKIGRAMVCGVTAVQIDLVDELDRFADCIDGDSTKLRSQPWGCLPILYVLRTEAEHWAYVGMSGGFERRVCIAQATANIALGGTGNIKIARGFGIGEPTIDGSTVTGNARLGMVQEDAWLHVIPRAEWFEILNAYVECPANSD